MANSISRQLLKDEAARRGWTCDTFGDGYMLVVTNDKGRSETFRGTQPMNSSSNGELIARRKHVSMAFLEKLGYQVPAYHLPESLEEALAFMLQHRAVVVKPVDSEQSKGVTVNVRNVVQLEKALATAKAYSDSSTVMMQDHLHGNLYRLMVIGGEFVGAMQRKAAAVIGDGVSSVKTLIETANKDPRRGLDNTTVLKKIKLSSAIDLLGRDGIKAVPQQGQSVTVSPIDSVSAGGEAINVSEAVHPSWKQAMVRIANEAGLFICGYDVICDDISQPLPSPIPILELNAMPGFKLLHFPTAGGEPIDAAAILLDAVFSRPSVITAQP